jgi:hypothetical protein
MSSVSAKLFTIPDRRHKYIVLMSDEVLLCIQSVAYTAEFMNLLLYLVNKIRN